MKKIYLFLFVIPGMVLASCGGSEEKEEDKKDSTESNEVKKPTPEEAIDFNNMIVDDHELFLDAEQKVVAAIEEPLSNEEVDGLYNELHQLSESTLNKYKSMAPFDEEDEFRLAILGYYEVLHKFVVEKVPGIIEFHHTGKENIPEEEWEAFVEKVDHLFDEVESYFDLAVEAQVEFKSKYNI